MSPVCLRCGLHRSERLLCPRCDMTMYSVESDQGVVTTLYRLKPLGKLEVVPDGCLVVFDGEVET